MLLVSLLSWPNGNEVLLLIWQDSVDALDWFAAKVELSGFVEVGVLVGFPPLHGS